MTGDPLLQVLCAHPLVIAGGLVTTCAMLVLALGVLLETRHAQQGAALRAQLTALQAERDRLREQGPDE